MDYSLIWALRRPRPDRSDTRHRGKIPSCFDRRQAEIPPAYCASEAIGLLDLSDPVDGVSLCRPLSGERPFEGGFVPGVAAPFDEAWQEVYQPECRGITALTAAVPITI